MVSFLSHPQNAMAIILLSRTSVSAIPITQMDTILPRESLLQLLVKLAFITGTFLIFFPMILRSIDAVDNSEAFTFIAVGLTLVIIGEGKRASAEDDRVER